MNRMTDVTLPAETPDFVLTRVFAAPRALVYKCWMEPSHLARWWGPKPFTCPVCEVEARVGGAFHLVMRSPDGHDYPMRGTFLEIVPNERIVKTDDVSEHSADWHRMIDPAWQPGKTFNMVTTVSFADEGGATRVTVRTRFETIAIRDAFARIGMKEGWSSSLEKLDELIDAIKDAANEIHIRRLIAAPREMVFAAFSDPKGLAQWWGPNGFTTTTHLMDFREGGEWIYTMHGPDGTDYPNFVRYTAIDPGRRIAYDHGSDAAHPAMFKAVIGFTAEGGMTRVNLRLILADAKQRPDYIAFGAVEGGYQNLERLEAYLGEKVKV